MKIRAQRPALGTATLLALILMGAVVLRFVGLGWGLRHRPHSDERVFVESALSMIDAGDLDHRYYQYPGLFVYLLAPPLAAFAGAPSSGAYLVARYVVAGFGAIGVLLTFALGRRLGGSATGLVAALFLAVSSIDVFTSHTARPDVVLQVFATVALLAILRLDGRLWRDGVAGLAVGVATAVKFSGALLAAPYFCRRALAPGQRWRGMALFALVAAAATLAFTPYSLIHRQAFAAGVADQWNYHFSAGAATRIVEIAGFFAGAIVREMGWPFALLVMVGLLSSGRDWRAAAPLAAYPALTLVVHSMAQARFLRFLVPVMPVLCVLAAVGVVGLAAGRAGRVAVLAILAAVRPAANSIDYVAALVRPHPWDGAVDWVSANAPAGSTLFTRVDDLGLDRSRYEVVTGSGLDSLDRWGAIRAAFVFEDRAGSPVVAGMERVFAATSPAKAVPDMAIYRVPAALVPREGAVALDSATLDASANPTALPSIRDGSVETAWTTDGPQRPGEWIELSFDRPHRLARVELVLKRRAQQGVDLVLWTSVDGGPWVQPRQLRGRPAVEEQADPPSQVFIIEPARVSRLRAVQNGTGRLRWGVAEVRAWEIDEEPRR